MAAKGILIDSSVIIDYFRSSIKKQTLLYLLFQKNEPLFISVLTVYELFCGANTSSLSRDTEKLITLFSVLDFRHRDATIASDLYRQLKKSNQLVDTIDILIAATAITHSFSIATLNKTHFQRFSKIEIYKFKF